MDLATNRLIASFPSPGHKGGGRMFAPRVRILLLNLSVLITYVFLRASGVCFIVGVVGWKIEGSLSQRPLSKCPSCRPLLLSAFVVVGWVSRRSFLLFAHFVFSLFIVRHLTHLKPVHIHLSRSTRSLAITRSADPSLAQVPVLSSPLSPLRSSLSPSLI